jgi:pantoate--beta-alanine ligase
MRIVRTIREMRETLRRDPLTPRRATIGFVPTMGSFHDGHLALMRRAREECDVVVVSLFVNPAQFNDAGDLSAYPRDEERDAGMARAVPVDILFAPDAREIYPAGFVTTVIVNGLSDVLEGASRGASHFHGVTTVVAKLLNIVQPDVAFFGQKDAQQALIVRRMVRDLDFPVSIEVCPTVRESDGLAMSSRNVRLQGDDRARALALRHALDAARRAAESGARDAAALSRAGRETMIADGITPEYFAVVSPETLEPLTTLGAGATALVAVAARVGGVRLIDNDLVRIP